eukprot:TRINITY_DN32891_c0_g1_i1.p2 TRINITY_DN32891_c0_g1~~TRINITY_DN32891_c0_g1_i1.p2  ORF type:complete len:225 (+),score=-9.79 TRINITY_DN32891_c0_g1_i1:734-1408(+)
MLLVCLVCMGSLFGSGILSASSIYNIGDSWYIDVGSVGGYFYNYAVIPQISILGYGNLQDCVGFTPQFSSITYILYLVDTMKRRCKLHFYKYTQSIMFCLDQRQSLVCIHSSRLIYISLGILMQGTVATQQFIQQNCELLYGYEFYYDIALKSIVERILVVWLPQMHQIFRCNMPHLHVQGLLYIFLRRLYLIYNIIIDARFLYVAWRALARIFCFDQRQFQFT